MHRLLLSDNSLLVYTVIVYAAGIFPNEMLSCGSRGLQQRKKIGQFLDIKKTMFSVLHTSFYVREVDRVVLLRLVWLAFA